MKLGDPIKEVSCLKIAELPEAAEAVCCPPNCGRLGVSNKRAGFTTYSIAVPHTRIVRSSACLDIIVFGSRYAPLLFTSPIPEVILHLSTQR